MRFNEIAYGTCGHCKYREIQFKILWSQAQVISSDGRDRSWATIGCPRCAGVILLEISRNRSGTPGGSSSIPNGEDGVAIVARFPEEIHGAQIKHVPDSIAEYFKNSQIVLSAGVPSAAAVELRRTIEAAASHFNATGRSLVQQIQSLIDSGYVTRQFGDALTHVRRIGNVGAHASDEILSAGDIELASRFTEQLLRNLFEVPGELADLQTGDDGAGS